VQQREEEEVEREQYQGDEEDEDEDELQDFLDKVFEVRDFEDLEEGLQHRRELLLQHRSTDFPGGLFLFCSARSAQGGRCLRFRPCPVKITPTFTFKPALADGRPQDNLSFGSETGRTRSGTKGISGKANKKLKRKKQEFHTHRRAYVQESERLDSEEVRARTILALDRLGHQVLSTEPGGYDLGDWLRSLNSLLDDFEERIGIDGLPSEFQTRRKEALAPLAGPADSPDADSEIERLTMEEEAARVAIADLSRQAKAKLASLREERDSCAKELRLEKEKLVAMKDAKESRKFFSRLLGAGPSTAQAEGRVTELESKLSNLENEIADARKARSASGGTGDGQTGSTTLEVQERLEGIQERLLELQSAKQQRLQLSHEREIAAKAISDVISSMRLETPRSEPASPEI